MKIGILFPHQLSEENHLINRCEIIYLVEEYLFFNQMKFHKAKIAFHRASMKFYESYLISKKITVRYIESHAELSDIRTLLKHIQEQKIDTINYIDTTDNWLEKRIKSTCIELGISVFQHPSTLFLNTREEIWNYFSTKKRMFQTDFYKDQRIKRSILINEQRKPLGGKWTFDDENRLKYPTKKVPPISNFQTANPFHQEAIIYTEKYFADNYGTLSSSAHYPITFSESKKWLDEFLTKRFEEFGAYEDAIVSQEIILHHSLLSPLMNNGLLSTQFVIDSALDHAAKYNIPMNSLEGFIRQIIGWREFIRAVYEIKGTAERTRNYWGFTRKIPARFWTGETGIEPLDITIKKVLQTGYCHHIERLMIIGNFMLLCEFDPDEVYRWFMELFIDSYDWVMVPNVYGMSQFADGGLMATKPYISGSNYVLKMSNYSKGSWQAIWDGLFWRFMDVHRDFFLQNPRLGMLIKTYDKMPPEKKQIHHDNATQFLEKLDQN